MQSQDGPRRVIDNEHPMMIATAYSNDVYEIGQEEGPELQGSNTVDGRWNAIPDDLKENNVLLLHTNNLRQFAPDHIGQAYLQAFHEHGLQIAYEQGAPIMLLGLTAAATPENGGTQYNITADIGLRLVGSDVPYVSEYAGCVQYRELLGRYSSSMRRKR